MENPSWHITDSKKNEEGRKMWGVEGETDIKHITNLVFGLLLVPYNSKNKTFLCMGGKMTIQFISILKIVQASEWQLLVRTYPKEPSCCMVLYFCSSHTIPCSNSMNCAEIIGCHSKDGKMLSYVCMGSCTLAAYFVWWVGGDGGRFLVLFLT